MRKETRISYAFILVTLFMPQGILGLAKKILNRSKAA